MRTALARTLLTIGIAVVSVVGVAHAATGSPTRAEIRAAIKQAEHAHTLWATVNICNSRRYPNTIGIRGEMPALGFPSWMSLYIQVNYYSQAAKRFLPVHQATMLIRLGRFATRLEQGGQTFAFAPHSGLLNATIDFRWRRSGKLLGHTLRRTTAGHRDADFGSPPHHSAKQCLIP